MFLLLFQSLSLVLLFETPWTAACQASLSFTISWSLLKFMSTEPVMLSNYLMLCHPLLLLPSIFPNIRVFSNEWPKCWSFSFSVSPSNEYSGLVSFRVDWSDLFIVQGTLKSLLQHHQTDVWKHQFFGAQPSFKAQISHLSMTTGKAIASTIQTFVGKVTSLLFNTLSRFVLAFLPRSKHLLISWLQSLSTVGFV